MSIYAQIIHRQPENPRKRPVHVRVHACDTHRDTCRDFIGGGRPQAPSWRGHNRDFLVNPNGEAWRNESKDLALVLSSQCRRRSEGRGALCRFTAPEQVGEAAMHFLAESTASASRDWRIACGPARGGLRRHDSVRRRPHHAGRAQAVHCGASTR